MSKYFYFRNTQLNQHFSMKKTLTILKGLALAAGLFTAQALSAQTVQFIHNSPDPGLDSVDIYVKSGPFAQLAYDNFKFRQATDFISLPPLPGAVEIDIAPGNSTDISDAILSKSITPVAGKTYIVELYGVLDPSDFHANPSGKSTALGLFYTETGRTTASNSGMFDVFFSNAAPDMSAVSIKLRDAATRQSTSLSSSFD
jgi:hypothetical protein